MRTASSGCTPRPQRRRRSLATPALPDGACGVTAARDHESRHPRRWLERHPATSSPGTSPPERLNTAFKGSLAGLDAKRLIKPVSLRMKAQDGIELQGLLYLPDATSVKGTSSRRCSSQVHGGPSGQRRQLRASRRNTMSTAASPCSSRTCAAPPVSAAPTARSTTRRSDLDSVRDLVDMLAFLKTDGRVDADRAAVVGGSYGGYMVNAVLAAYPTRSMPALRYGVANWVTALEIASPASRRRTRSSMATSSIRSGRNSTRPIPDPQGEQDQDSGALCPWHDGSAHRHLRNRDDGEDAAQERDHATSSASRTRAMAGASSRTGCSIIAEEAEFLEKHWPRK